jgi:hypothetical protein
MKIRIDDIETDIVTGQTILDAAVKAGIYIPTLCHLDGVEPYSSCMVCVVKDRKTNNYIPSCTAKAMDGMDIDSSGEDVIRLRKKAVEMLLSEHRAECEAPCRIVCPAGYNIPLMNRLLQDGNIDAALELAEREVTTTDIVCADCPAYCENACRRKKIDEPVSIRNLMLYVYHNRKRGNGEVLDVELADVKDKKNIVNKIRKKFSSRTGKIEPSEQQEWLKEVPANAIRSREITDLSSAASESVNCMHCDCRAADNCRLRDVAVTLNVKDPQGKMVNAPVMKKINTDADLIFEHAKCIKCGLCVRLSDDCKENTSLCFVNRGFITLISEPLTGSFEGIDRKTAERYIEVCPTGALSKVK